jgi:hypothetical protein
MLSLFINSRGVNMKQFEYEMINRTTGRVEHARATAKTADIARLQIILMYGRQFDVLELYSDINPPHHILGEIDCADFPDSDIQWLINEVAKQEVTA